MILITIMITATTEPIIKPLNNEDGLLSIKVKKHKIDNYNLVCTYNMTHMYDVFTSVENLYKNFLRVVKQQVYHEGNKVQKEQIKYMLDNIESKLFYLLPRALQKKKKV